MLGFLWRHKGKVAVVMAMIAAVLAALVGVSSGETSQNQRFYGYVDHIILEKDAYGQNVARVLGWATDLDKPHNDAILLFTTQHGRDGEVDDYPIVIAGLYRPDVEQVLGLGSYHGFQMVLPAQMSDTIRVYRVLRGPSGLIFQPIGEFYALTISSSIPLVPAVSRIQFDLQVVMTSLTQTRFCLSSPAGIVDDVLTTGEGLL